MYSKTQIFELQSFIYSLYGNKFETYQWRSQNTENVTHIKGKLLEQAVIILIAFLFIIGTSLKVKNLLPQGAVGANSFF